MKSVLFCSREKGVYSISLREVCRERFVLRGLRSKLQLFLEGTRPYNNILLAHQNPRRVAACLWRFEGREPGRGHRSCCLFLKIRLLGCSESGWSGSVLDSRAPRLRAPLQCCKVRPGPKSWRPTIKNRATPSASRSHGTRTASADTMSADQQRQGCAVCAEPLLRTSRENGMMRILQDMVSETA